MSTSEKIDNAKHRLQIFADILDLAIAATHELPKTRSNRKKRKGFMSLQSATKQAQKHIEKLETNVDMTQRVLDHLGINTQNIIPGVSDHPAEIIDFQAKEALAQIEEIIKELQKTFDKLDAQ